MRFPCGITKEVEVFHLDTSTSPELYALDPDEVIVGGFVAMDRTQHALEGGQLEDPHELYVSFDTDIREADQLLIEGRTFKVRKVYAAQSGRLRHKRCSISAEPSATQ